MKGKLDKNGSLFIERNGNLLSVYCPFQAEDVGCGSWCALFGEPETAICGYGTTKISLCKKVLVFSEFTDER